jgi:hypothetical protein
MRTDGDRYVHAGLDSENNVLTHTRADGLADSTHGKIGATKLSRKSILTVSL